MTDKIPNHNCTRKFLKEWMKSDLEIRKKRLDALYKQGRASPQELKLGKSHLNQEMKNLERRFKTQ